MHHIKRSKIPCFLDLAEQHLVMFLAVVTVHLKSHNQMRKWKKIRHDNHRSRHMTGVLDSDFYQEPKYTSPPNRQSPKSRINNICKTVYFVIVIHLRLEFGIFDSLSLLTSLGLCSISDVITFDQNWHHLYSTFAGRPFFQ